MGGEGLALLFMALFGGLLFGGSGGSGGSSGGSFDDDDLPPEAEQPPEVGDPTIFDDTDGQDDGFIVLTSAPESGAVLSGGVTADGPGAEAIDETTPDDVFFLDPGATASVTVLGGIGNDNIIGNAMTEDSYLLAIGGEGSDAIAGGEGEVELFGGPGADTLFANGSLSGLHGGEDDDRITVAADTGLHAAFGDAGDDVLSAGRGQDGYQVALHGGAGDDILAAGNSGSGEITQTGGSGNDVFILNTIATKVASETAPGKYDQTITITDFGNEDGPADDGDTTNNDYLDLWRSYDSLTDAKVDFAADGDFDQHKGLILTGVSADDLTEDNTGLADVDNFVDAQATFQFGRDGLVLIPRPIVGGGAITHVNWDDGTTSTQTGVSTFDISGYYTRFLDDTETFTVSLGVESTGSENIDIASYIVDMAAQTVTPTDPVARWF